MWFAQPGKIYSQRLLAALTLQRQLYFSQFRSALKIRMCNTGRRLDCQC